MSKHSYVFKELKIKSKTKGRLSFTRDNEMVFIFIWNINWLLRQRELFITHRQEFWQIIQLRKLGRGKVQQLGSYKKVYSSASGVLDLCVSS